MTRSSKPSTLARAWNREPDEVSGEPVVGRMVWLYTDGACIRNPGPGAYAAFEDGEGKPVAYGSEKTTTNNRMEMRAVIEGLRLLPARSNVTVVTDSKYVLQGFTEWLPGWRKRGWRTADKKPVKNADLWQEMTKAVSRHARVEWKWVRGHAGNKMNERVDAFVERLARSAR